MFLLGRPAGHCQYGLPLKVRGGKVGDAGKPASPSFGIGVTAPALRIEERLLFRLCRVEHPDKVQDIHRAIAVDIGTCFSRRRFAEMLDDTGEV